MTFCLGQFKHPYEARDRVKSSLHFCNILICHFCYISSNSLFSNKGYDLLTEWKKFFEIEIESVIFQSATLWGRDWLDFLKTLFFLLAVFDCLAALVLW
jgi:hypothetical protein